MSSQRYTSYDQDLRRRVTFGLVGLGLLAVVGYVLVRFRATLVFTIFLYYASRPIYHKLDDVSLPGRLRRRPLPYRRQLQAMATIGLFLLPFLLLFGYTLVLVVPELQDFFGAAGIGGTYLSALQATSSGGLPDPLVGLEVSDLLSMTPEETTSLLEEPAVQSFIDQITSTLINSVDLLTAAALHGFILLSGTYYLLTDGSRLVSWVLENFDRSGVVEQYVDVADDELSSILFGNILNAVVTGIIGVFVFLLYNLAAPAAVRVPFPPLVGALTGVGSLIPVVGMKIVYIPVTLVLGAIAVLSGDPAALGFVVLLFALSLIVVDTIPDFLIRPYVSGNRTHVGLLMFAYILGPVAFGFYGIFLGPIILVLLSQFLRIVGPYVVTGDVATRQLSLSQFEESDS